MFGDYADGPDSKLETWEYNKRINKILQDVLLKLETENLSKKRIVSIIKRKYKFYLD